MSNRLKWFVAFVLLLALAIGMVCQQVYGKHDVGEVVVMIPTGSTSSSVANILQKQHIISSAWTFRLLARITAKARDIKAGEYRFSGSMNLVQVLNTLVAGKVVLHHITVVEGLRTQAVLDELARQTHTPVQLWQKALHELLNSDEVEGYLLPETYTYILPLSPKKLLKEMLDAQKKVLQAIAPKSRHKLRVMASIVEKETALDKERRLVSAVIYNRLRLGMPLQMDPTVIYGVWRRDGVFSGNLHRKDLSTDTPWNTYTRKGLPPTPICNPSKASLFAAANPADVDYLYFVADGSGGHAFASTLAEHQSNVKKWVRLERER